MLRDIKDNISSPKNAFKHINDKIIKSISYLLILTLLLMLPLFIYLFTDRTKLTVSPEEIRSEVGLFLSDEIKIVDGKLLNENNNKAFFVSGYYFVMGDYNIINPGVVISFKEEHISISFLVNKYTNTEVGTYTYQSLGMENYLFNNSNRNDLSYKLSNVLANNNTIITYTFIQVFFSYFIDMIMIVLILSLLSKVSRPLPFTYSNHFNINAHLTTIYAVIILISGLFGLGFGTIIAWIAVILYNNIAYRSIRIIKKGRD